jgi:serine/threonine protein kinase
MPADATTPARVVDEAGLLLRTIRDEIADGRKPYAADVRRLVERGLSLRFAEFVQFLERYGFLTLERRTDLLALTKAGVEVAEGHRDRLRSLEGDAVYHFGERLAAAAASLPEQVRGVRFDKRYLRYECIGAGGMGTVWRGRLLSIDRPVAIKALHGIFEFYTPEQREEILRRLELAVRDHARLVNPFVVQYLDQNVAASTPYYVMELATGGNLRGLLGGGPLPPAVAVRYFVQIALGLRAAHAEGLLHRDLKPENVLLDGAGNVKLSDFGITRILERDGGHFRQAYVGFGSVGYMAPEMFRPGIEPTVACDIYSLGILLYEMLSGTLPGRRSPMPSTLVKGLPVEIDELFDQMTQDDPAARPKDLDAVLTALWTSKAVVDLLDARQAPLFTEPPVALPGLRVVDRAPVSDGSEPAPRAAEPEPRRVAPAPEPAPAPAPEPARAEAPQPPRAEAPRSEPPRSEPARVEAPEPRSAEEAPRPPTRVEGDTSKPAEPEAPRPARSEPPRPAPARSEAPRAAEPEAPRPASEAPRAALLPDLTAPERPIPVPMAVAVPVDEPDESAELLEDSVVDDPDPSLFSGHEPTTVAAAASAADDDSLEVVDVDDLVVEEAEGAPEERFSTAVVDTRGRPRDAESRNRLAEQLKRVKKPR